MFGAKVIITNRIVLANARAFINRSSKELPPLLHHENCWVWIKFVLLVIEELLRHFRLILTWPRNHIFLHNGTCSWKSLFNRSKLCLKLLCIEWFIHQKWQRSCIWTRSWNFIAFAVSALVRVTPFWLLVFESLLLTSEWNRCINILSSFEWQCSCFILSWPYRFSLNLYEAVSFLPTILGTHSLILVISW